MAYSLAQLQDILRQAGWPDAVVSSSSGQVPLIALMAAVGKAESGGNPAIPNINSRERSIGLWQINMNAHPEYSQSQLVDPIFNAEAALSVYQQQGLRAWGAYTDGSYLGRGQFNQSLAIYNGQQSAGSLIGEDGDFFGLPWLGDSPPPLDATALAASGLIDQPTQMGTGTILGIAAGVVLLAWLLS